MRTYLETIRTFRRGPFAVTVTAREEDDLDLSFDTDGTVAKQIDDGSLIAFRVEAKLVLLGRELATDHLGNCIYGNYREFMDHFGVRRKSREESAKTGRQVCYGSYFSDMVRTVIQEGRAEAAELLAKLQSVKLRDTRRKGTPA